jgi:hypothetical protein
MVSDDAITPLLSGKIYDDVIPSRAHAIANRIALWYCRVAGIRTVEAGPEKSEPMTLPAGTSAG